MGRRLSIALCFLLLAASVPAGAVGRTARGVTADEIRIGVHLPTTGAVPLPNASAERGADLYWRWLRHRDVKVNGRNVEIVTANDNTNPSQARAVCRELIREQNAFMLWGALQPAIGGAPSIITCAREAEDLGAPYVSLGNTKQGLRKLDGYFATSAVLARQTRAMSGVFAQRLEGEASKNAIVWWNASAYAGLSDVFASAIEKRGLTLDASEDVPVTAGASEAQAIATQFKVLGIENVFVVTTPVFMMQLVQAANNQSYFPNWTTMGFSSLLGDNLLASMCSGSEGFDGTLALSPVPAFGDRADYDPAYDKAIDAIYPDAEGGDMTTWLGWAAAKQLRRMLEASARKLTPARFLAAAEAGGTFRTDAMPPFRFSERDHFGGRESYLLQADCAEDRWKTLGKR